jgi:nucleotide-binding universal stress UspA family protein
MMKKILVPVDFSPASLNAVQYAAHLAAESGARFILLYIFSPNLIDTYISPEMQEALLHEEDAKALACFARIVQQIPAEIRENISPEYRIAMGPVQEEILFMSDRIRPDLVVMGMRGSNHVAQKMLGSTAAAVVQRSDVPVMVVPEHASFHPIREIAFATNFEDEDLIAIDQLLKFAAQFDARVHCIHIRQNKALDISKQEIMRKAFEHDVVMHKMDFDTLSYVPVVEGLNHYVKANEVDILVMLTHQRGIFSHLFHQSQTRNMVLQAAVPLWAFQMGVLGRVVA